MKVILRKDHDKLGAIGTIVEVKDGFARNFLIPKGIAYPATDGHMRTLEEEKRQASRRSQKEERTASSIAADLEKISLTIKMKVGEDEKLFGSVTAQMIADELQAKGITLDKRIIDLEEPIKALGIYTVNVKLHHTVTGAVKVWVVRE
jgi:large subunit ribosomal protein L9